MTPKLKTYLQRWKSRGALLTFPDCVLGQVQGIIWDHLQKWISIIQNRSTNFLTFPPHLQISVEAKDLSSVGSLHLTHSQPKCFPLKSPILLIVVVLNVLEYWLLGTNLFTVLTTGTLHKCGRWHLPSWSCSWRGWSGHGHRRRWGGCSCSSCASSSRQKGKYLFGELILFVTE